MRKFRIVAILLVLILLVSAFSGCGKKEKDVVRLAVHSNESSTMAAIGIEKGIFEKYGLEIKLTIVDSGPPEMAAMRADNRSLDIGYIGQGVAWNPLDGSGNQVSYIYFDNLGNSEKLIANKDTIKDTNGNGKYENQEVYDGIKGQKVYLELGTTPAIWFKNYVARILNEGRPDSEKLWLDCNDKAYLNDYTAPNKDEDKKITVVNYSKTNLPSAMATGGTESVKIAVAATPTPAAIIAANKNVAIIADNSIMPEDCVSPGVWVASNDWIENNKEVVQRTIDALYECSVYRAEHLEEALRWAEKLCQKPANTFNLDSNMFLGKTDYETWFASDSAKGYQIMNSLYNAVKGKVPEGAKLKTLDESFKDEFMLNSISKNK